MPETDAVILDNFFPQPTWVELRKGSALQATFTGQCETLAAYNGVTATQLYAAVVNGTTRAIYRVDNTAGGAVGSPVVGGPSNTVQAITSTRYDWAQYGTGSAEVVYLVNGADPLLLYDGSTWQAITGSGGTYQITGVTTSTISLVAVYKQRVWFGQTGTFNVYYLPQNSIAGAATELLLAPNFMLGGSLQAIVTVSIDNAAGLNDYIAFVSTVGEVVVFQGYDPSSVSTWSLAAHFRIGHPIGFGRRCWQKVGSDAVLITADGFIAMSDALLTDRSQTKNAVSDKIRKSAVADIMSYGTEFGWQIQLYPIGNKLLINVPTTENSASYTYVMNTLNGAWATVGKYSSAWNAICFETMGDKLYFGTNGQVRQADTGSDDAGAAISGTAQQAFSYFGLKGVLKSFGMCRPIFTATGSLSVALALSIDENLAVPSGTVPTNTGNLALWNTSPWNVTGWGDATILTKNWIGVAGIGYSAGLQLQVAALDVTLQWQSTDFMFQRGGLL